MHNYISKPVLIVLGSVCALLAVADLYFARHASFEFANTPLFYCVLGFVTYATLIFMAKALRRLISRSENYYRREAIDAETNEAKHD